MKTDLYLKAVATVIAISLSIIAIQLAVPTASAQRVDDQTKMLMMRLCEKQGASINCADITSDFYLKVQVKDLDRLPSEIASQISGRLNSGLSLQLESQYNRLSGQLSEMQLRLARLAPQK
jgi:hypothetical protein